MLTAYRLRLIRGNLEFLLCEFKWFIGLAIAVALTTRMSVSETSSPAQSMYKVFAVKLSNCPRVKRWQFDIHLVSISPALFCVLCSHEACMSLFFSQAAASLHSLLCIISHQCFEMKKRPHGLVTVFNY